MGLTKQSTGSNVINDIFDIGIKTDEDYVVALAGNPNTGKSTVFNALTGMNQHTGNWPGKTVTNARGRYKYREKDFVLVDLPGTYSLLANSAEEEVARDFLCFGQPAATVVVTDATCLERNLNLVLQVLEITDRVVVCVNLIDEAKRKDIEVDIKKLALELGVPVVATNARDGQGLKELKEVVWAMAQGNVTTKPRRVKYGSEVLKAVACLSEQLSQDTGSPLPRWIALQLADGDKSISAAISRYLNREVSSITDQCQLSPALSDEIVSGLVRQAEEIGDKVVKVENPEHSAMDRKIDRILTSRLFGLPSMLFLLGIVFWLTIQGANYPSEMLATFFFAIEDRITYLFMAMGSPVWLHGILVLGIYRTLAWVVSVMLPPMAIFFPLFTLLEDLGYLPRVAFNLDRFFKKAGAHGKQALTMCMGFGCNAAGVIACRIIDSPRERLIATLTNNFVPCNGRFPILISMAVIFIAGTAGAFSSVTATLAVLAVILVGIGFTLLTSRLLTATLLKGIPSSFTLELPPYRKPQVGRIIIRSIVDRTLFVLGRAMVVAAPAGVVIWMMANIDVNGISLLNHGANVLQPLGHLMGLDGFILMAFILGMPANEIVIPIVIMSYMATGAMLELDSLEALRELLVGKGWTWLTALNVMLLTLLHFPCGTTLLTIQKETQSWKWTGLSFLIPTVSGILVCILVASIARMLGFI